VDNLGFVAAGYLIAFFSLAGYTIYLRQRARSAARRAARLSTRR
jgi:hypothetical protein